MRQKNKPINRRRALELGNKMVLGAAIGLQTVPYTLLAGCRQRQRVFNVLDFGATGNGTTLDTLPIQKAIDAAAEIGLGSRVILKSGYKYLIGTLELKGNIDFHLEGDAELMVSTNPSDYSGRAAIVADGADHLTISGTGSINGRAMEFMSHYDAVDEWWRPKKWRPRLFMLTACNHLAIHDISIHKAPSWSLHLLGCEDVTIDNINIRNDLDVPNCDGIDPDHCRKVRISNCHIVCGDDAIVIKTTRQEKNYGPSSDILVTDCVLETQDSGLKIGTETTQDIYNIQFRDCKILTSCRGLTIQLRDEGNVRDISFKNISFVSRYHSDPWWGRGEAISLTAYPRTTDTKLGPMTGISFENISGKSENSARINGSKESRIRDVHLNNVNLTLSRHTNYKGGLFDNRPTKVYPEIEEHHNPGFHLRFVDQIILNNCSVKWGSNLPEYYTHALEAEDVTGLEMNNFKGISAHPDQFEDINIF